MRLGCFAVSKSVVERINHSLHHLVTFLSYFYSNLQPQDDKAKRTMIHKVVKERFNGRMVSETSEGTMRLRMHKKKDDFGKTYKLILAEESLSLSLS